ncbi:zf-CCHC domain-containing protein [Tanacetum coccineum]
MLPNIIRNTSNVKCVNGYLETTAQTGIVNPDRSIHNTRVYLASTDIKEIDKNKDKARQNQARDQKEREKISPARFYIIEPNESIEINSIIESRDAIFDENRFSLVPRPSLRIPNGTEDIGSLVVPEEVTEEVANLLVANGSLKKLKVEGTIEKFKAMLVIQGFKQKSGIDYLYTYAPASKKQTCITGSTVALAAAGKETEWLKNLLLEIPLWSKPIAPISVRYDSVATLAKAYSQIYNEKSRHLGVRHSMIRELITNEVVQFIPDNEAGGTKIPSGSNPSEEVSSAGLTHQQVIDGLQPDTGSQQPTSNSYETRRELWYSLEMHKKVCEHEIVGINISMRAFNDCINKIEIADVNSTGLHCTWNQKPKGETGILKKIDRLMYNINFNNEYPVGYGALENEGLGLQHVQASEKDEGLFMRRLSTDKAANMVRCVSDDEIQSAMFSIGNDKVSGPDSYTSVFFKKSCDVVGMDICNAVRDFFSTDDIISDNQSAFVLGRSISNNIFLTQELVHNYHLNRGPPRILMEALDEFKGVSGLVPSNKQVKDNKIDLFVQQYEQFIIYDDETIDCAFVRFNTIVTTLKALDESFSSRNHVRKFLRALPTKWRLKVYEVVLKKDSEVSKNKKEKYKSMDLKAKKVSSDEEVLCSDSDDEEYATVVMDFKKFFRRRGKFVRQQHDDKKSFRRAKEEKKGKEERRCFKCGNPNHFISECPKHSFNDQKAFVGGCWSDSEEEDDSKKDEICLMALDNNERIEVFWIRRIELEFFVVSSEVQARIRRIFLDGYGVLDVKTIFFRFLRLSFKMRAF